MGLKPLHIVVEAQKTTNLQNIAQSFEVFYLCFYAICTDFQGFGDCDVRMHGQAGKQRTTARNGRDGALYSTVVIMHYCNANWRDAATLTSL